MDNNFINIDDLVRQRLSGASEPERSGAWNRMSALLDEEDRRKPLGIYWNRVMNYCGVAMLMAAVSVGGYEMTTAFRTTAEPAAPGSLAKGSLPATGNNTRSTASGDLATATGVVSGKHAGTANSPAHNPDLQSRHNVVAAGNTLAPSAHKNKAGKAFRSVAARGAAAKRSLVDNTKSGTAASTIAGATLAGDNNVTATNDNVSSTINVASATRGNTNVPGAVKEAANATGNTAIAGNKKATVKPQQPTNTTTGQKVANNMAAATPAKKKEVVAITEITEKNKKLFAKAPVAAHAVNAKVARSGKLAGIYVAGTVKNNKKASVHQVHAPAMQPHTVAATASDQAPVKPIEGKKVLERIVLHQTVTGVYGDHVESRLDTISIDEVTIALKQAREKAAAEKAAVEYAAKVAAEEKAAAMANARGTNAAKTSAKQGAAETTATRAGTMPSTTNTVAGKVTAANTPQPGDNVLASAGTPAVDPALASATATQPAATAAADVVPNAAPPAASTPANEKPAAKKGHGLNLAEKLSDKFNEVKFKLGNTQFAPGLTAGINGTFFGPNSFRGFQFGFTGAFEVDEHWTFMTELKYFHRVNNNYSMNDYYNKYTAVSGGFEKDSVVQTYSFATLHSFELPLTMRYNAGKCSFFAGGNFVYTLAVNADPGIAQSVDPNIITKPVVANNTVAANPNIHDADFKARFGIGYIFGLSYRVAPNVTFDLRNVQTVWDNAKDGGSKTVSNQLFKSPSLQFSIQYRLGRGNNENRD